MSDRGAAGEASRDRAVEAVASGGDDPPVSGRRGCCRRISLSTRVHPELRPEGSSELVLKQPQEHQRRQPARLAGISPEMLLVFNF